MFVCRGVLEDRAGVKPRLVREGGTAHIGRLAHGHAVEDVVERSAELGQPLQRVDGDPGLIAAGIGVLEQKRRDQRRQVGIPTALAQSVQRALHLSCPGLDRGQAARNGGFGIVMGVNAKPVARNSCRDHLGRDTPDFLGQRAAIGVAKHDPARTRLMRGPEAGQRIVGIRLVAIEEMLGIEQRLASLRHQVGHRLGDILDIFGKGYPERGLHVEIMGLANKADRARARVQNTGQNLVVFR